MDRGVSSLCVGVEERSLRSHLFVVIYSQELLSVLKHNLFVYVFASQHVSRMPRAK